MQIRKNPLYAVCLSVLPGLGQIYNGEMRKGYMMMVGALLAAVIGMRMGKTGFLLTAALWLVVALEAYQGALKTASGKEVKRDPYLALALSHLLDGAGQIYNGEVARGVFLSIAGLTSCLVAVLLTTRRLPFREFFDTQGEHVWLANVMITWFMIALGLRVFALVDAFFTARNRMDDYLPRV